MVKISCSLGKREHPELPGDLSTDLAVIKIDAKGLRPAMLGDSSQLEVGQNVIAIGHALGLPGGPTVSKGVVSALGRSIDTETGATIIDLIQTAAARWRMPKRRSSASTRPSSGVAKASDSPST